MLLEWKRLIAIEYRRTLTTLDSYKKNITYDFQL